MKSLSILLLSLFSYNLSIGQATDYCGTEMPDEMVDWLRNYKQNPGNTAYKQAQGSEFYIPLKIHIVGNDDGGGYHKTEHLLESLCHLNNQYEPLGFHFYLHEDINYINNSALYDHGGFSVGSIVRQINDPSAANLYFVKNPAGACGYFSGWGDFIALSKSCSGPDNSTIAHELGHYFSLPHTFYGWEGRNQNDAPRWNDERVDGSNCDNSGDYFCDTPADYLSNRWNCPFNRVKDDYNGDEYEVDGSLFMSYANDDCQSRFSDEQIDAMKSYLQNQRANLLNHPDPLIQEVEETAAVYPANNASGIPANYVNLKWRASEGATHYSLLLTRFFNGNFYNVDMILEDTSVVLTDLEIDYTYRWKVKPFNAANTCTGYTDYSNFHTTDTTSIIPNYTVTAQSCAGMDDGAISVEATGGTGPYTYHWSNGDSALHLENLSIGNYELTIIDSNNDSLVLSLDVAGPDEVNAKFLQNDYQVQVFANGGIPPYSYYWSNGSRSSVINMTEVGDYAVTVTDNGGCQTAKVFNFTGVEEPATDIQETLLESDFSIYPNPVSGEESLTIEVKSPFVFEGNVSLFNNAGKQILSIDRTFQTGVNVATFDLSNITQGVYHIRILSQRATLTKKVVIF